MALAPWFKPALVRSLRTGYGRADFLSDLAAGLLVGVVALPLSIGLAIASGVSPEQGLYTAIIGGVLVSLLGGSRVQVAGPAGAFVGICAAAVMLATMLAAQPLVAQEHVHTPGMTHPAPAAQLPTSARPRLVLRAVTLPDYLDRRELVRRSGAAEIVLDENAHWAERPGKAITRWVTLALAAQRLDYAVESYTTADGRPPDALLSLTLESFEPGADGIVRLRGSWIFSPKGKASTRSGRFDADQATRNDSAEARVAALQQALAAAVNTLASQLPEAAFAVEPPR